MNIQLSISIWTVICFILLMLILHFWLLKPLLQLMDKRQARIDAAKAEKEARAQKEQEQEEALLRLQKEQKAAQKKQFRQQIEAVRAENKKAIDQAREQRLEVLDTFRAETKAERAAILDKLSAHSEELAKSFADSLLKE